MSNVFEADTLQRVACRPPRGRPEPEVWWERAGQRVPTEGRVYQDGLDLVFSPTVEGDSGTYTCVATNKAGRKTQEVTFTVASKSRAVHPTGEHHQSTSLTRKNHCCGNLISPQNICTGKNYFLYLSPQLLPCGWQSLRTPA